MFLLTLAAAQPTAIEKLHRIPPAFWLKIGLAVLVVVAVVIALRKLAHMNKIVLTIIGLVVLSTVGFSWIYERNEPAWATPMVEKLAGFFPSKGAYSTKQQTPTRP